VPFIIIIDPSAAVCIK